MKIGQTCAVVFMLTPFNLRFAAALVALPVSILAASLLSGCGGGGGSSSGGGGGNPSLPFNEEFNGASLNLSNWGVYGSSQELQRTRFGTTPQIITENGVNFARLTLDTYNPNNSNRFRGTEIYTLNRFPRGNGLEIEARLRGPINQPGIVFAFFTIYDRYNGASTPANYSKSEIDYEFLTAEQEASKFPPGGQSRRLYLNVWDDWNEVRDGYDGDDDPTPSRLHDDKTYGLSTFGSNFNWKGWNTYKIRWYPNKIEYVLNDVVQRTETRILPDEDMSVHFNIWSGNSSFDQAYSEGFNPTNEANNQTFNVDVDYLRVRSLSGTTANSAPLQRYEIPAGAKSLRNR